MKRTVIVNAHVVSPGVDMPGATIVIEGRKIKLVAAKNGYDALMASIKKPERVPGKKAAIVGGIILILIGLEIFITGIL